MSGFALLRSNGSAPIDVERVDLNIWVLPSLFRRHVYLCDIGVCCKPTEDVKDRSIKFELRIPFLPDNDKLTDLVRRMRENEALCSLVFGSSDLHMKRNDSGTWVNDDGGPLLLTDICDCESRYQEVDKPEIRSRSWTVSTGPMTLEAGTRLYLRVRTTTHDPNRMWTWRTGAHRNSYALCDLRFNEFREKGDDDLPVDFSKVMNPSRVNGFLITSAQYREVRTSPVPEYIRVLEGDSWIKYLDRRLSRGRESFLITYWKDVDISPAHPYRAFIEVERRLPTTTRAAVVATCVLLIAIFLTQPTAILAQSPAGVALRQLKSLWPIFAGGFSLGVMWKIIKIVNACITKGNLDRARQLLNEVERRWYRIK